MDLSILWFVLIGVLFVGYFILEGFDMGVGILLPFLGKSDVRRRVMINTIGPHWDGNEVWLITAGGAMFAAFPHWYATLFSGFYVALFLLLAALIVRGVAFEFRSKDDSPRWRALWDWCIFFGSAIPALLWGVAFANLVKGVPIDANMQYVGTFWNLINIYSILGGLVSLLGFTLHGAIFLTLKTTEPLATDARRVATRLWIPVLVVMAGFIATTFIFTDILKKPSVWAIFAQAAALLALLVAGWLLRKKRDGIAFGATALSIALSTAFIFFLLFPRVMVSSLDPSFSLTVANAASGENTLRTMSIVALILVPVVLAYQGWSYWIFRKRITEKPESLHY
ncbi:MAG TPA: cytochrome d ubiquinol oxidase subunit II [Anaerolineaceae bacterium]|nr:cytochrome d ubiquinol oxidase subunit II [Longilinea sp.]NMD30902.1 cytochrome d ubiquinol oxidase subunit II [Chloroflexota bacterium]HNS63117.1 cytochrome d ubiquinol oxidase subunit II [Anaerolineaceae bacterium]HNZ00222.1 cytochrome d ubiquinol oxidase subunit II [Anaerolineaceae bacterium]HOD44818.1 cytochrome d ubiquinol oxidase subunit II [Anaerolineaceae bacterium]